MSKFKCVPFDLEINYFDRSLKCDGTLNVYECKNSPLTEEAIKNLEELNNNLGKIKSITIKF